MKIFLTICNLAHWVLKWKFVRWNFIFIFFTLFYLLVSVKTTLASFGDFQFETDTVRYVISADGLSRSLLEKTTSQELLMNGYTPFAAVKKKGKFFSASDVRSEGNLFRVEFNPANVRADFSITNSHDCIVIQLVRLYGEGVEEVRLAQLRPFPLKNEGILVTARWDEKFAISLMGLSDKVDTRLEKNMISATVYPDFGMEGACVAIVAVPTSNFLKTVQSIEGDFQIPSPMLSGQWAKVSHDVRESYLFTDLTEANADETIRYAKIAGFKYILIYSGTWSTSNGSYPINTANFLKGEASLKAVIDKVHAAGLKVGMHMLTSFVGKNDPLVNPVPDSGLLKDAEAILSKDINVMTQEIIAVSELMDFPEQQAFYGTTKAGLDIQIDDEIIHYSAIGGPNANVFLQCIRGYAGTKAAEHKSKAKIYHLAERYGSYLADLRTPLKERISERVAGLINRCGFDMIYFDGGEVNVANGPASWYWVSQQQMDIWKRVKRDVLVQGSGVTPWSWHIFSRFTCDDFAAVATKEYLDYHKIADVREDILKSFLPVELGWWGFLDYAPHHPATSPDEVEYYAVRMLALDAPVSLETNLKVLKANGRTDEMLKLLGAYEQLRLKGGVPPAARDKLRAGEWHMVLNDGNPEFHPIRYDVQRVEISGDVLVKNEFDPQQLKFRVQAIPQLSKVGDRLNVVLYERNIPQYLKSPETKKPMPGALIDRIEYTKPVGDQASVFTVGPGVTNNMATRGKALDLTNHRGLAVKLKVDGPALKPGEPCDVLNIQLESGGKTYRDHYIDLSFTGERTIIIPEPNTERMLREFRPADANYSFKAAMYDFNYKGIVALNFRWMRQSASRSTKCQVTLVEALTENASALKNPAISLGTAKIVMPVTLKSGDYFEYWGTGQARLFNRNGMQLAAVDISGLPMLSTGENRIRLSYDGAASAKLTTILMGDELKF